MTHFAGDFTVHWEGSHSTQWLADQRRITATKFKTKKTRGKALGLYLAWWSQVATQERDFPVMLDRPLNTSFLCSVTRKKETKQWETEEEREKGNLCVPLFHDMPTVCAGYWTTWIFGLSWGSPFYVAYRMNYVYIHTTYGFYCVCIASTYSQSLSVCFLLLCLRVSDLLGHSYFLN